MIDYRQIGRDRLLNQSSESTIPLEAWDDFPLFFTTEYLVRDVEAEVGFYAYALGLDFLSLAEDYVIVKNPDSSTFSFKYSAEASPPAIKLQWFTKELDRVIEVTKQRRIEYDMIHVSEIQRLIRMYSPGGMTLEIWSGDES